MNKNNRLKPKQQPEIPDRSQKTDAGDSPKEVGGPKGPEPTRYGDWEKAGRCIDF